MSDLKSYRLFYLTAKLGSISRAAEACNIDRTAASRRMQLLENEFNKKLFTRTPQGVEITRLGEEISKKMGSMLSLEEDMKNYSTLVPDNTLSIMASYTFVSYFLSDIISEFMKKNPEIIVNIMCNNKGSLIDNKNFDFSFYGALKKGITEKKHKVAVLKRSVYASQDYVEKYGVIKNISDLSNHKFIIFGSESEYFDALASWPLYLNDVQDDNKVVCSVNSVETMVKLAEAGVGAIGMSDYIIEKLKPPLVNISSKVITNKYSIFMYYNDDVLDNTAAKKFFDFICKAGCK